MLSPSATRMAISCCDINLAQPLYEAEVFVTYKRLQRKHSWRGCVRDRGPGIPTYIPTFSLLGLDRGCRASRLLWIWCPTVAHSSPQWPTVAHRPHSGPQWPTHPPDSTHPPRGSELPPQPCHHCKETSKERISWHAGWKTWRWLKVKASLLIT